MNPLTLVITAENLAYSAMVYLNFWKTDKNEMDMDGFLIADLEVQNSNEGAQKEASYARNGSVVASAV